MENQNADGVGFLLLPNILGGFPGGSAGKESTCSVEDPVSIPRLERSPEEGNGNPLRYSFLENLIDRRTWQATVHRVPKSQT